MSLDDSFELASRILGFPGAMLSGSKRNPPGREDHVILWNACVFQAAGRSTRARHRNATQIWWGDLDVTAQADNLRSLARAVGATLYVTPEQPWRFEGFAKCIKSAYNLDRVQRFDP